MPVLAHDCIADVVNLATDSTTITSREAHLFGVYVNTVLSAHACPIERGDGTAIITLIASLAAGSNLEFPGIRMKGGIIVDPDNAATGNITVLWKPA